MDGSTDTLQERIEKALEAKTGLDLNHDELRALVTAILWPFGRRDMEDLIRAMLIAIDHDTALRVRAFALHRDEMVALWDEDIAKSKAVLEKLQRLLDKVPRSRSSR